MKFRDPMLEHAQQRLETLRAEAHNDALIRSLRVKRTPRNPCAFRVTLTFEWTPLEKRTT
jgi:hypothetical protein